MHNEDHNRTHIFNVLHGCCLLFFLLPIGLLVFSFMYLRDRVTSFFFFLWDHDLSQMITTARYPLSQWTVLYNNFYSNTTWKRLVYAVSKCSTPFSSLLFKCSYHDRFCNEFWVIFQFSPHWQSLWTLWNYK